MCISFRGLNGVYTVHMQWFEVNVTFSLVFFILRFHNGVGFHMLRAWTSLT